MGNLQCKEIDSFHDSSQLKDFRKAQKILALIISGQSAGKRQNGKLKPYQQLFEILEKYISMEESLNFMLENESSTEKFLRQLSLEHVKQWLLLHPHSFDVLMKDMHMESTVKWIQVKQDLMEKMKQYQTSGSYTKPSTLGPNSNHNLAQSYQASTAFKSQTISTLSQNGIQAYSTVHDSSVFNASSGVLPRSTTQNKSATTSTTALKSRKNVVGNILEKMATVTSKLIDASVHFPESALEELLLQFWHVTEAEQIVFFRASSTGFDRKIVVSTVKSVDGDAVWSINTVDGLFPLAGIAGDTWKLKTWCRSTTNQESFSDTPPMMTHILGIPLVTAISGVILIYYQPETGVFTTKDREISAVTTLLTIGEKVLDISELNNSSRNEARMLELLLETSAQLSKTPNLDQALITLENTAKMIVEADFSRFIAMENLANEPNRKIIEALHSRNIALDLEKQNMICPLASGRAEYGIIELGITSNRRFSPADFQLIRSFLSWSNDILAQKRFQNFLTEEKRKKLMDLKSVEIAINMLEEWIGALVKTSRCCFYFPKHLLSPTNSKLTQIRMTESSQGLVALCLETNSPQRQYPNIPRIYHTRDSDLEIIPSICYPLRYGNTPFGVLECQTVHGKDFMDDEVFALAELCDSISTTLYNILEKDASSARVSQQEVIFETLAFVGSDMKLSKANASTTRTSNHTTPIDISCSTVLQESELSKTKVSKVYAESKYLTRASYSGPSDINFDGEALRSKVSKLLIEIDDMFNLKLDVENILSFVNNAMNIVKSSDMLQINDRLLLLSQVFGKSKIIVRNFMEQQDIIFIILSIICIHSEVQEENAGNFLSNPTSVIYSTCSSKRSGSLLGAATISRATQIQSQNKRSKVQPSNLVLFFAHNNANILSSYDNESTREIFRNLAQFSQILCRRGEIGTLLKKVDKCIHSYTERMDTTLPFTNYFDVKNDGTYKQSLLFLFSICFCNSFRVRPWSLYSKWIQMSVKETFDYEDFVSTGVRGSGLKVRLSQELGIIDTVLQPCFELMKQISQYLGDECEFESLLIQLVENRKKVSEFLSEELLGKESSNESFYAEEIESERSVSIG